MERWWAIKKNLNGLKLVRSIVVVQSGFKFGVYKRRGKKNTITKCCKMVDLVQPIYFTHLEYRGGTHLLQHATNMRSDSFIYENFTHKFKRKKCK